MRTHAAENIDGLDHKVVSDKRKLYNPKKAARPAFLVTINDIPH